MTKFEANSVKVIFDDPQLIININPWIPFSYTIQVQAYSP